MAIDTSGKWWVGSEPSDIGEYLSALEVEGYPVDRFVLSKCRCGSVVFELYADQDEGCARGICAKCSREDFIVDSEEIWDEEEAVRWTCTECGSANCNVGVGFSLYSDEKNSNRESRLSGEVREFKVRWISVGLRCTQCGTLGCVVDWKVGRTMTGELSDFA